MAFIFCEVDFPQPERREKMSSSLFPAAHSIGSRVLVQLDCNLVEAQDPTGASRGKVVGVRFTARKVLYDIQLAEGGHKLRDVDSFFVMYQQ